MQWIVYIASCKICRLAIAQCVSTGPRIATKYYNDKYIGTAMYVYTYIRTYIALYMIIVAMLCFIYVGLYMELGQEKYM